jgi:general secretion pathway protein G
MPGTRFDLTSTSRPRRLVRRGFTLLEVIVVVTIIALLAALVAPKVWKHIGGAKEKIAQAEVSSIAQQVRLWMVDNGLSRIPDDFDLSMLADGEDPYMEPDELLDPWDTPYEIHNPGTINSDFDIVSLGADGERGGEGESADITN